MLLIKNVKILTAAGKDFEKGCILIKDGKISKIAEKISENSIGAVEISEDNIGIAKISRNSIDAVEIIDGNGMVAVPGFVDAHTHLGMWEDAIEFEGADGNEMTEPVTPEMRGIDGINPMDRTFEDAYKGGITSVASGPGSSNVIGGQFAAIKTYGFCIDDMIIKQPIAIKCAFGENPKRVYGDEQRKSPMTRMATAALLREALMEAREYMKGREAENAEDRPDFNFRWEAMLPLMKKEIPLKAHAHRADDIFTALRIAKEFDLDVTLDHCTEGHLIADKIKMSGKKALVGPSFGERAKFELKNLTFETPGILANKGIEVSIITDHPVVPIYYLPLCAALAVKAGMKREDAFKAITINPAKALNIADRVGSLEVGKDADVVIWSDDPLDFNSEVIYTIINGEVVYRK